MRRLTYTPEGEVNPVVIKGDVYWEGWDRQEGDWDIFMYDVENGGSAPVTANVFDDDGVVAKDGNLNWYERADGDIALVNYDVTERAEVDREVLYVKVEEVETAEEVEEAVGADKLADEKAKEPAESAEEEFVELMPGQDVPPVEPTPTTDQSDYSDTPDAAGQPQGTEESAESTEVESAQDVQPSDPSIASDAADEPL
jgi:hypothetical protein